MNFMKVVDYLCDMLTVIRYANHELADSMLGLMQSTLLQKEPHYLERTVRLRSGKKISYDVLVVE